jgi:hypothetical protein
LQKTKTKTKEKNAKPALKSVLILYIYMYVCICREWLKTEWFENDLKIAQSKQKTKLGNQSLIHELKVKQDS